jgi:hypothetical protein
LILVQCAMSAVPSPSAGTVQQEHRANRAWLLIEQHARTVGSHHRVVRRNPALPLRLTGASGSRRPKWLIFVWSPAVVQVLTPRRIGRRTHHSRQRYTATTAKNRPQWGLRASIQDSAQICVCAARSSADLGVRPDNCYVVAALRVGAAPEGRCPGRCRTEAGMACGAGHGIGFQVSAGRGRSRTLSMAVRADRRLRLPRPRTALLRTAPFCRHPPRSAAL